MINNESNLVTHTFILDLNTLNWHEVMINQVKIMVIKKLNPNGTG